MTEQPEFDAAFAKKICGMTDCL